APMKLRSLLLLFLLVPVAVLAQDDTPPLKVMALILGDINQRFDEDYSCKLYGQMCTTHCFM
ncbi:MAG: hypothetical protein AAF653_21085, partial [Chloroflexota bacterium]